MSIDLPELKKLLYELDKKLVDTFHTNKQNDNSRQKMDNRNAAGHKSITMDLLMEKTIIDFFTKQNFPCIIESEEAGTIVITENARYLVIVDPLDGSNNFRRKIPLVCYGIAIAKINENSNSSYYKDIIAASVRSLYSDEFFVAIKNEKPILNGYTIEPSKATEIGKAIISIDIDHLPRKDESFIKKIWEVVRSAKGTRRFGANLLDIVYVGAGKLDAMLDLRGTLSAVHVAGLFISESAGAIIHSFTEAEFNPQLKASNSMNFIITNNQKLMEDISKKMKV